MSIDLANFETEAKKAVRMFWKARDAARRRGGDQDQGERAGVTAGKNMDGCPSPGRTAP